MASKAGIGAKISLEGEKEYRQAISNITKAQSVLRSEMKLVQSQYTNNGKSTEDLKKAGEVLQKQLEVQSQKVATLRGALEDAQKKYGENSTKAQDWTIKLNRAEAELNSLNKELQQNQEDLKKAENATERTTEELEDFSKETKDASDKVDVFGDVLKANLLSDAIKTGIKMLADGIKTTATYSTDVGVKFEAAMSQVAATMGMTVEEIEGGSEAFTMLENAAKEAGATTMFSAEDAGEALNYLALAGYDVKKSVETLPVVLDLAAAGGIDLAYSSDLVTDSMSALGDMAGDTTEFVDKMAKTSQKSNTSVAQLGEAILTVGGTAKELAGGTTELNTALGILADNGIKGSEGGTALRNVILSLAAPTDTAAQKMEKIGFQAYDSNGKLKPLNVAFRDLNECLDSLSQSDKNAALSKIFNKQDLKSANALLANCNERFDELSGYIDNADGAAKDMADTLNNNLKGKLDNLESATEAVGITMYEKFEVPMKQAVDSSTEALDQLNIQLQSGEIGAKMDELAEATANATEQMIDFAMDALPGMIDGTTWMLENLNVIPSVLSGATVAWGTYKVAALAAEIAQRGFNTALGMSPIGLLLTGIAGLTAGLLVFAATSEGVTSGVEDLVEESEKLNLATDELIDRTEESKKQRKENKEAIETEIGAAKILSDELYKLADKEQKTTVEKQRMKTIIDQLNEAVPELSLEIDEQTGFLNKNREETEKLIDAKLEYLKVEAAKEDLTNIAKEQYEKEKNLADLTEHQAELTSTLNEKLARKKELEEELSNVATDRLNIYDSIYGKQVEELQKTNIAIDDINASLGENAIKISEVESSIEASKEEFQDATKYVSEHSSAMKENEETINDVTYTTIEFRDKTYKVSQDVAESWEEVITKYYEAKEAALESIQQQMGLFDEFDQKQAYSKEQMLKNLQSQIDGMANWANDIDTLAKRGIDEGLLKTLQEMGPSSYQYTHTLVTMTDEEIAKLNNLYIEKLDVENITATKMADASVNMDYHLGIMEQSTKNTVEEIARAGEATANEYKKRYMYSWGDFEQYHNRTMNTLISNMGTAGVDSAEGFSKGLKNTIDGNLSNIGISFSNVVGKANINNGMRTAGSDAAAGFYSGFNRKMAYEVIPRISEQFSSIVTNTKNVLQIKSPSRVFAQMGDFTGEGFEIGAIRSLEKARRSISTQFSKLRTIDTSLPEANYKMRSVSGGASTGNDIMNVLQNIMNKIDNHGHDLYLNGKMLVGGTVKETDRRMSMNLSRAERGLA